MDNSELSKIAEFEERITTIAQAAQTERLQLDVDAGSTQPGVMKL